MKSSIADLIQAYKQHENLYNQKHKLYYNKQARNLSLKKILDAVKVNQIKPNLGNLKTDENSIISSAIEMKQHWLRLLRRFKPLELSLDRK